MKSRVIAIGLAALVVLGVLLAAGGFVSAGTGSTSTNNAFATRVIGVTPQDGERGLIWWGGGTILQLATRMSQNGCDLDVVYSLESYKNAATYELASSYRVGSTEEQNREFLSKYGDTIPAGTRFIVVCKDAPTYGFSDQHYDDWDCDDKWSESWSGEVTQNVLSRIATMKDLCFLQFATEDEAYAEMGRSIAFPSQYLSYHSYSSDLEGRVSLGDDVFRPVVVVIETHSDAEYHMMWSQVYEACHAQQEWYVYHTGMQERDPHSVWWDVWTTTPAGEDFVDLLRWEKDDDGVWELPEESIFRNLGVSSPAETAAILCMIYFLDQMDLRSEFDYRASQTQYIPEEVTDWIEQYVAVLPSGS